MVWRIGLALAGYQGQTVGLKKPLCPRWLVCVEALLVLTIGAIPTALLGGRIVLMNDAYHGWNGTRNEWICVHTVGLLDLRTRNLGCSFVL